MGKWLTKEARLAYHREYNKNYRKEHPEKISQFKKNAKYNRLEVEQRKELNERTNHRATFLLDEYDEGGVI